MLSNCMATARTVSSYIVMSEHSPLAQSYDYMLAASRPIRCAHAQIQKSKSGTNKANPIRTKQLRFKPQKTAGVKKDYGREPMISRRWIWKGLNRPACQLSGKCTSEQRVELNARSLVTTSFLHRVFQSNETCLAGVLAELFSRISYLFGISHSLNIFRVTFQDCSCDMQNIWQIDKTYFQIRRYLQVIGCNLNLFVCFVKYG